jgi:hypothetical protein
VLELVRLGLARVHQPEGSEAILVERAVTAAEAKDLLADYDEVRSFGQVPESGPATPVPPAPEPEPPPPLPEPFPDPNPSDDDD